MQHKGQRGGCWAGSRLQGRPSSCNSSHRRLDVRGRGPRHRDSCCRLLSSDGGKRGWGWQGSWHRRRRYNCDWGCWGRGQQCWCDWGAENHWNPRRRSQQHRDCWRVEGNRQCWGRWRGSEQCWCDGGAERCHHSRRSEHCCGCRWGQGCRVDWGGPCKGWRGQPCSLHAR